MFRRRGIITAVACLVAWVAARPTPVKVAITCALVIAGQALRLWAAGHIAAYRGESLEAPRLVTGGPYAIVRNPLYIGNGLIGLGWSLPAGPVAVAVFLVLFVMLYAVAIVPYEEKFLAKEFGTEYDSYRHATGRWLPAAGFDGRMTFEPFDGPSALRSESHSIWLNLLCTVMIAARPLFPPFLR